MTNLEGKVVGFLGPEGTFTEEALTKFLDGTSIVKVAYNSIEEVLIAVHKGAIEVGFVPIENSTEGGVNVTLDMLIHEVNLKIIGEITIPIRHNLIATSNTKTGEISKVYSHPQAIAQCKRFLRSKLSGVKIEYTESTVEALKKIKTEGSSSAAIGTLKGAKTLGLTAIEEDIQDYSCNKTKFVMLSKISYYPPKPDYSASKFKTSLIFSLPDYPGALFEVLRGFAECGINLKKIESRPAKKNLGEYIFLIDVEGHQEKGKVKAAILQTKAKTTFFKDLGSYLEKGEV